MKAIGGECGICKGWYGPIHYDEPSDAKHPLSFVIDEIKPVSRYKEFGYESARQAAEDWSNLQPAHYICNQWKSNRTEAEMKHLDEIRKNNKKRSLNKKSVSDGEW